MPRLIAFIFLSFLGASLMAQTSEDASALERWREDPTVVFDSSEVDLNEFVWIARPLVIFADSPNDPRFLHQMELLAARPDTLAERDVLIVTDTDASTLSPLRERLRPRGFMLVIMGKDGEVELRKPQPWDVREITRSIDKMPLRQQEINEGRAGN